jgi:hypothetical protein
VIKEHDDFIAELLAEISSEDDSDSDFGPDYDGGVAEYSEEDLEEVPGSDAPQEQVLQLDLELEEVSQEEVTH